MGNAIGERLRKEDVIARIQTDVEHLVLEIRAPDDDAFHYIAKQRVMEIVVKEIDSWEKAGQVWTTIIEYLKQQIEDEFTILDEQCIEAEAAFDNTKIMVHELGYPATRKMPSLGAFFKDKWVNIVYPWLSKWEFKLGEFEISMRSVAVGYQHMSRLINREKYMRKLVKKVMKECFSEEAIRHHVTTTYFVPIENYIQKQCDRRITGRIKACKRLLISVARDDRIADEILNECQKMDRSLRPINDELCKIQDIAKCNGVYISEAL
ncbi:hypothetical protein DPMN_041482 [Dreissena polymorpha]|uniref:Uncharacterized protein n=1 Tax=Dreissena polymorpha TaxID=45954 RepID=A0A9D4HW28_DREPO|nr:hypothetical protein DPMN_041482 [Dreissena polymorpha]